MKPLTITALLLLISGASTAFAEWKLPADGDKEGWHQLGDQFAECSAVYNLAATLKDNPAQGNSSFRELANNALIAGMYSTERAGLPESYLETAYSKQFDHWQELIKDKANIDKLFAQAEQCISNSRPVQNQLVATLRTHTAHQ